MAELKKSQNYRERRAADTFMPYHEWSRTHQPGWVYPVFRVLMTLPFLILFRPRAIDIENVPTSGPAILAVNHLSNLDHFFVGAHLRRHLNFMGKSQLFAGDVPSYILNRGGVFPVRRGAADEEAFKTAYTIFERGGLILMYPEGGRSRTGKPGRAKPGVGRMALESGVPVVPVAVDGTDEVRNWKRGRIPAITVAYGKPITFDRVERPTREQQQEVADTVFAEVTRLVDEMKTEGRRAFTKRRARERREREKAVVETQE